MIDLLWPFRRKTSIILPHTTNFFLIYNGNGRVDPGVNDYHEQIFYSYPTIDLAPEVKQVLEICGAPYSLKFQKNTTNRQKFSVRYSSRSDWNSMVNDEFIYDIQEKVLDTLKPVIYVPSSKFIKTNEALMTVVEKLGSDPKDRPVRSRRRQTNAKT